MPPTQQLRKYRTVSSQHESPQVDTHRLDASIQSENLLIKPQQPAIAGKSLTEHNVLQLQRLLGNQEVARLVTAKRVEQCETKSADRIGTVANIQNTLQRMVWNIKPGDEKIDKDAENMATQFGPLVNDIDKLKDIQDGQTLHIVSHLEKGTMGDYDPEKLAELVAPYLKEKTGMTVDLHGCFAAHPGALGEEAEELWKSYAGRFQIKLAAAAEKQIDVVASLGAEYTSDKGHTRVRKGEETHKTFDDYIKMQLGRTKGGDQNKLAKDLTNKTIEEEYGPIFHGSNKGRIKFVNHEKDEIVPLVGEWDEDFNNPEGYTIAE